MTGEGFLAAMTSSARRRAAEAQATVQACPPRQKGRERLTEALAAVPFGIIAEAKRRSPSRGQLASGRYDPAGLAARYQEAGAVAMSVLTEPEFFGGSLGDLVAARNATSLPLLRKDFLFHPAQVDEAAWAGADAVLAIVRILAPDELAGILAAGRRVGIDVLVEVHNHEELMRAVDAGATLIGVNNRDLDSFATDWRRALKLASAIPDGVLAVAESGISTIDQLVELASAGYRAALVGEALMTGGVGLVEAARAWAGR
jgi:indole-3-glycerol phosphate synthase